MRGALACAARGFIHRGIIPADAGSTVLETSVPATYSDHPRGCGEHVTAIVDSMGVLGSSPRMRGALSSGLLKTRLSRIIPADAGSTRPEEPCWTRQSGSSPRMRGARQNLPAALAYRGIIPADAGSTDYDV